MIDRTKLGDAIKAPVRGGLYVINYGKPHDVFMHGYHIAKNLFLIRCDRGAIGCHASIQLPTTKRKLDNAYKKICKSLDEYKA